MCRVAVRPCSSLTQPLVTRCHKTHTLLPNYWQHPHAIANITSLFLSSSKCDKPGVLVGGCKQRDSCATSWSSIPSIGWSTMPYCSTMSHSSRPPGYNMGAHSMWFYLCVYTVKVLDFCAHLTSCRCNIHDTSANQNRLRQSTHNNVTSILK